MYRGGCSGTGSGHLREWHDAWRFLIDRPLFSQRVVAKHRAYDKCFHKGVLTRVSLAYLKSTSTNGISPEAGPNARQRHREGHTAAARCLPAPTSWLLQCFYMLFM